MNGAVTLKLGGTSAQHASSIELVGRLAVPGWVVVHGGGRELDQWSARLGLASHRHDGLRITDDATLELASAVLGGLVNVRLVARLRASGAPVLGMTGVDGGLLVAVRNEARFGAVGEVSAVDTDLLDSLAAAGQVPVVAPLAASPDGEILNVNADGAAGAIAAARGGRLILCTDVPGVLSDGRLLERIELEQVGVLLADGAASDGMRPKLRAAARAAEAGCDVRIVDGRDPDALLAALAGEPAGTAIVVSSLIPGGTA